MARTAAVTSPAATARAAMPRGRVAAVDLARGVAVLAMIGYHFAYDLRYFGLLRADFEHDPRALFARTLILAAFLLLAGVSVVLADRAGVPAARFWRHVGTIAACALLVTAGSYAMFPRTYIWFGVLHAIALTLVLARPLARRPLLALVLGAVVIAAGLIVQLPLFDSRALDWVGFRTTKPFTVDYVPLFPWAGVVLVGIAVGHALVRRGLSSNAPRGPGLRTLATLGRHTLLVYMVHQPILIGALWAWVAVRR